MTSSEALKTGYLLGGRRVLLSDLLAAHLLNDGDDLEFHRPRTGERHRATVRADGKLYLQDGRSFSAPSRAASAAVGRGSFDGWLAWRHVRAGVLLDSLRQELLDSVAEAVDRGEAAQGDSENLPRHAFLKVARERAATNEPVELRVRELLDKWGATARDERATQRILADLDNHGLTTVPNFLSVGLDTPLSLHSAASEVERDEASEDASANTTARFDEVGLTLGNIATPAIVYVSPSATLDEAVTLMLLNDFSQLPVMRHDADRNVEHAVTWQSIGQARHADTAAGLSDVFVEAEVFSFDTELTDVLPRLVVRDFVLVKDAERRIFGIVTTADVAREYGNLASPFFVVGELDRLLRRVIDENFDIEQINGALPHLETPAVSADGLGFADYQNVLTHSGNWESLGWPLDRKIFRERLNSIREARNDIMHFNPDPVAEGTVENIRNLIRLVRTYS